MSKKNRFTITLAGKSYTLCGAESADYLKTVGSYIEDKYNGYYSDLAFRSQPVDMQHILMQLNIADDYFKCLESLAIEQRKYEEQCLEVEKLQKTLVDMQVRYENLEASTKLVEKRLQDAKSKITRLEKELKNI